VFMLGSFPLTLIATVRISLLLLQRAQKRVEEIDKTYKDKARK